MRDVDDDRLSADGAELVEEAVRSFRAMFGVEPVDMEVGADMRYRGQSHELEVKVGDWADAASRFHEAHLTRFGFERPDESVEVVNVRATARGTAPLEWSDLPQTSPASEPVARDGVWERRTLPAGFALDGPAIVVEDNSATLLESGDHLEVLSDGTLRIEL